MIIYFNLVFVFRRFGFEVLLCTDNYFLVLGINGVETMNTDIPLMLNDILFVFKRLQFRLKVCFAMMIINFNGKLLKSQELY